MSAPAFPEQLTLREALDLHHRRLGANRVAGGEDGALFDAHDACHAVFGCDLSLRGETLVDTWTMTATTMTVREYVAYVNHPAVRAVLGKVGWFRLLGHGVLAVPWIVRVLWRGYRVTAPWSFWDWDQHLDQRLVDLRAAHGIVPVTT